MYSQDNKIKGRIIVILLSCLLMFLFYKYVKTKDHSHEVTDKYDNYVEEHFNEYQPIYDDMQDTLDFWAELNLGPTQYYQFGNYQLDSLLAFNEAKDRVYTTLNKRQFDTDDWDDIQGFRGHLIKGEWYFTFGASYMVDRKRRKDNFYLPLTQEEISYVARTKYIGRFLKEDEQGELVSNEDQFHRYFVEGYGGPDSKLEDIEAFILKQIYFYHRDTLDQETIDDITQDVAKRKAAVLSAPPKEYKKTSPPKLFDSEAWKNRHKVEKN